MKPLVSILIPVFNGSDYLASAIDSALAQTYRKTEIIVVNDGSDDDGATRRIAVGYGERIRYLEKTNGGVASALNAGLAQSSGDYIAWLSHDDLFVPQKIARNVEYLADLPAPERERAVVYSDYAVFTGDVAKATPVQLPGVVPARFRFWLTASNSLHGCTLLLPRAAFRQTGTFREDLRTTQDFDMWFRMAEQYRFHHMPEVLVLGRSHAGQGSMTMASVADDEINRLLSVFVDALSYDELASETDTASVSLAYARLAQSMFARGFTRAARHAHDLSVAAMKHETMSQRLATRRVLLTAPAKSFAVKAARRAMSPHNRARMRRLLQARSSFMSRHLERGDIKARFSNIYHKDLFGGDKSRSGAGSDLVQTTVIREALPSLLTDLNIKHMLDAPCGDWHWMQHTRLPVDRYIGVDIVESLVARNKRDFGFGKVDFVCADLIKDPLPATDLILSRDCLVHLSNENAKAVLRNFVKSGARYLLTTSFTDRVENDDLTGKNHFWRPINLSAAPFCLPPPLRVINENCTEEGNKYADKSLCLWALSDVAKVLGPLNDKDPSLD